MSMFRQSAKASEDSAPESPIKANEDKSPPAVQDKWGENQPRNNAGPSVINAGLTVRGDLESDGEISIEGKVEGDTRAKTVIVGKGANVQGSLFGDSITVAGTVEGKIEAANVIVQKTARVTGDIIHKTVQIEAGAYVDGRVSPHLGGAEVRPAKPEAVSKPKKEEAGLNASKTF